MMAQAEIAGAGRGIKMARKGLPINAASQITQAAEADGDVPSL
jgi:hypothetical protein